MSGMIDWAAARARMVLAFVALTLAAGLMAYVGLPKEGEPDIEVPALFISVPFQGISASDSETLLVRPMEQELSGLTGLTDMTATAYQGYASVVLEFEFDWDKNATIADVRDRMSRAATNFPEGADSYTINEFNFSQFPIVIVAVAGDVPERTLMRAATDLQRAIEGVDAVLSAEVAGTRDEMVEVVIDPLRLEAYNVSAGELINAVTLNNQLVAAGEIETESGRFSLSLPGSFEDIQDIYELPIKVNGDRTVTLGDLATIHMTFQDRTGTARFNGEPTLALQVVKRKGFNLIDTVAAVRAAIDAEVATWPQALQQTIHVTPALDRSYQVASMIDQLEGSVLTAIALVMIVVLASLGTRTALLVGFSIPSSFLLSFILLGIMGVTISNIVMFGLILAVGMLVDGAIVVAEYADNQIAEGKGPMAAYTTAAKRMFWPVVSSTATTLCAFLPMLFWPGVAGEFMGMLPVTLIFVLASSLIVALIYLPILGGVTGRIARRFDQIAQGLRRLPWLARVPVMLLALALLAGGVVAMLNPGLLFPDPAARLAMGALAVVPGALGMALGAAGMSITLNALKPRARPKPVDATYRHTLFGWITKLIVGNPVMPFVATATIVFAVWQVFTYYGENNYGVDFFVETEPEQGIVYVRARGNLSLAEKDAMLAQVEAIVLEEPGVAASFAFGGSGGLNSNTGGGQAPRDAVGQIQFELVNWDQRGGHPEMLGQAILDRMEARFQQIPGIITEYMIMSGGPASAKPIHLRLTGQDFDALGQAVDIVQARMREIGGITGIEDSRPLPGIDWEIRVDTAMAGRFGADVATVGGMVQLVTRGIMLDTMRVETSDEEIEIRVRLPEEDRLLATLDTLRVPTARGLVPLSNFVTRAPVALRGTIDRYGEERYFDVKADAAPAMLSVVDAGGQSLRLVPAAQVDPRLHPAGSAEAEAARAARAEITGAGQHLVPVTPSERIAALTQWLTAETPLPDGVNWQWTGEQQDQEETGAFLGVAFSAALGLMFIILLAQFNSFYNAILVLLAVVLSTAGVLIGMLVMGQSFSMIMTGTGVVALAGIVVNNNIVLIDTYQEFVRYMPRLEAIVRTAEQRLRPVLLTTITTMAGLAPMMLGLSIDFVNGGYTIDSPTSMWWKPLATAVVFGLGVSTVLTLVLTPALLAVRVWVEAFFKAVLPFLRSLAGGRARDDRRLKRRTGRVRHAEIIWDPTGAPAAPASVPEKRPETPVRGAPGTPRHAAE
ncbi:efflux RND transporter permease subunit [Pararhodobacter aggregans]|uniref:Acriflavine resistance protein B n=1 Tax=Pararhodobacter aggregans TaxID=404875 RepID=A0A2T7UXJ1_9RHOB|nr:efflux RND transporter permease subunit [Pararhodobacter aggregans]PTX05198.1 multidrug efflux pump [Pararhodobacter aggregans]PVE49497.1 acriflavine resistance protein B [Pararhodobacter aggregans]